MADGTIDRLVIDISSNANQAISNLDRLGTTLDKLATKAGTPVGRLNDVADSINRIKQATVGLNFKPLESLNSIKISSTIPKNLQGIVNAINTMPTSGIQKLSALSSAMVRLRALQGIRLTSTVNQLAKLPAVLREFQKTNMGAFIAQIRQLSTALEPLARNIATLSYWINRLPRSLRTQAAAARTVASTNRQFSASLYSGSTNSVRFMARCTALTGSLFLVSRGIARCINESNTYIENMNLFQASMGDASEAAGEFATKMQDALGIDAGEFMRNQGIFQTLITGMGETTDRATIMSQQLTQLGYDITSYFNLTGGVEQAMQKLQSGIAGELEPLRRIGWDLSNARIQLELNNRGIDESVQKMTQAQKVAWRYYLIMSQVTQVHGDMARTIQSPANQLRVLQAQLTLAARAVGNVFIPTLNMILPYAIAAVKAIRLLAEEIASLLGIDATFEVDYSSLDTSGMTFGGLDDDIDDTADAFEDVGDNADDANEKVKKLKNTVMGFDELNKLNDVSDAAASKLTNVDTDKLETGIGYLPDMPTYDPLAGFNSDLAQRTDEMAEELLKKLREIAPLVAAVAAGFAAWKIANLLTDMAKLGSLFGGIPAVNFALGIPMLMADMGDFAKFFEDFLENGPTFYNVAGMLSEFAGMLGDAFIMLGNLKLGGFLKLVQGLGEIIVGLKDIIDNGPNWDNVSLVIKGLTNVVIGISLLTGKYKIAGWALFFQGLTKVITEIGKNWDAIKNGDWSGVDKVALITGGLEMLGGLVVALDVFGKLKQSKEIVKASETLDDVATTTQDIDTKVSGNLSPKLKSLAKNLGFGLLIIAEVAAAAAIFIGAIIGIGYLLAQLPPAWQPVIDNGMMVITAIGLGTLVLGTIGLLTYALGTGGKTLAINMGIGALVLAEIGLAAGIFLAEIWAIGWALDQIGQAWQPVLDNGGNIAIAILIGTGVLLLIGVAAAALGAATVATAGALPLAILLGAVTLLAIGLAAGIFLGEIWAMGFLLDQIGQAWQPVLDNGDAIALAILTGTGLLVAIGAAAAGLGLVNVLSFGTIDLAIMAGSEILSKMADAFNSFCEDLIAVSYELGYRLLPALNDLVPKLPYVVLYSQMFAAGMEDIATVISSYTGSMGSATWDSIVRGFQSIFADDPISNFADTVDDTAKSTNELNKKLMVANPELMIAIKLLTEYTVLMDTLKALTDNNNTRNLADGMFTNLHTVGQKLVTGLADGMESKISSIDNAVNNMKNRIDRLFAGMTNTVIDKWNVGLGTLEHGVNNAVVTMNSIIRFTNSLPGIGFQIMGTFGTISLGRVPHLASGGLLNRGQLFVAREAGPELVGTMGNRTAVANNGQIVEGIEQGVVNAMLQVMMLQGSNAEREAVIEIPLIVGNEEIARAAYRGNLSLIQRGELVPQYV